MAAQLLGLTTKAEKQQDGEKRVGAQVPTGKLVKETSRTGNHDGGAATWTQKVPELLVG